MKNILKIFFLLLNLNSNALGFACYDLFNEGPQAPYLVHRKNLERNQIKVTLNEGETKTLSLADVENLNLANLPAEQKLYVQLGHHHENRFDTGLQNFVPSYNKTNGTHGAPVIIDTVYTQKGLYEKVDHFNVIQTPAGPVIRLYISGIQYERPLKASEVDFVLAKNVQNREKKLSQMSFRTHVEDSNRYGEEATVELYQRNNEALRGQTDFARLTFGLGKKRTQMISPTINVNGAFLKQDLALLLYARAFERFPQIQTIKSHLVWTNLDAALKPAIDKLRSQSGFIEPNPNDILPLQFEHCCLKMDSTLTQDALREALKNTPAYKLSALFGFTNIDLIRLVKIKDTYVLETVRSR